MSRKTREATLATRRRKERTRLGERTHGRPERMSRIGGGGAALLDEAGRTAGVLSPPGIYSDGVWSLLAPKALERLEGWLLLPAEREEARLPPADVALVAQQEP